MPPYLLLTIGKAVCDLILVLLVKYSLLACTTAVSKLSTCGLHETFLQSRGHTQ